jgi:hypothetical protein
MGPEMLAGAAKPEADALFKSEGIIGQHEFRWLALIKRGVDKTRQDQTRQFEQTKNAITENNRKRVGI